MSKLNIQERIREYYCTGNGEWLMEKGKVKEARLLKEACERIETLENRLGLAYEKEQKTENYFVKIARDSEKEAKKERDEALRKYADIAYIVRALKDIKIEEFGE